MYDHDAPTRIFPVVQRQEAITEIIPLGAMNTQPMRVQAETSRPKNQWWSDTRPSIERKPMSLRAKYRARAERKLRERESTRREPLSASQHILHLLLTVFTAGLWAPVWIIRSGQGNRRPS